MIQLRGLRTGVEISGLENYGIVGVPSDLVNRYRNDLLALGFQIDGATVGPDWALVGNPDVWPHDVMNGNKRVGQFVMGSPSVARAAEYRARFSEKEIRALCGGVALGREYWLGFRDVTAFPSRFVLRGSGYPTTLMDSDLRPSSRNTNPSPPAAMAFDQGVFGTRLAMPSNLQRLWQIETDASTNPVGYVTMQQPPAGGAVRQQWWAFQALLDGGLIPSGGDGEWVFSEIPQPPRLPQAIPTLTL
ncbi:MAG: hypothetical protein AAF211_17020 [Myxococcota bacterium]